MKFKDMPYKRVEKEELEKALTGIMEEFKAASSGEEQFEIHKKYYELMDDVATNMTVANIRHDVDTTDSFYDKEKEYYDEMEPIINNLQISYDKLLYNSSYRDYLVGKIGPVAFKSMELSFKAFDEKLIPLMQEENNLVTSYNKLIASAKIDWEGETLNLSLMTPYLSHVDRDVRIRAWNKYTAFFEENGDKLDEIFDKLVKNRTAQARELGYENYVELGYYRMNRNCYGKEQVENFRRQVKEVWVPFVAKLNEKRKQRLGLDKLAYYDEKVYFQNGNPKPTGTPEEILQAGQKMYCELSDETREFFDFMMENQLFDVLGRKTKRAGGYMTYLPNYKSPFIFANFNGTSGDVDVITHECGHAFQGFISGKDPIREHANITMETAEIHSMSMEFFTEGWMDLFFGDRKQDYIDMHLEDSAAFIPYGCMVDEFQHIVYENPDMTPAQRNAAWRKLEMEYKPHLDYEDNKRFGEGGYWQRQLHIYNYPFYYIDYCLPQTCALQYTAWMDQDYKAAWQTYLTLCGLSASDFYVNMLKEVGLKLPFEEGCMKDMADKLEKKIQGI